MQEIVTYEDLGPEAIRKLVVENFPAVVINDIFGRDLLEDAVSLNEKEKARKMVQQLVIHPDKIQNCESSVCANAGGDQRSENNRSSV